MTRSGHVMSNGLQLFYEIVGDGQPMILLNGGPGFPHDYLEPLRALADDMQLVFYDQRGTGQSDKAPPAAYTVDANVDDLEALRQELGIESFVLFGHSWGGMLAQAYILKYPQHVAKLILADTFSSAQDCTAALQRMRAAVPEDVEAVYQRYEREGVYAHGERYPDAYQAAIDVAYEPVSISVPPPPVLQALFGKLAYDVYRTMWGDASEFTITGTLASFDVASHLHNIRVAALVIVGASDMPTVAMAQKTAHLIPNGILEVFEHSRHYPFLEEPEKFFAVVRRFIHGG